jgi:hypothetical protein
MKLYHGTPNRAQVLATGVVRPSDRPEPFPDVTAAVEAYRKLVRHWRRRWPHPAEPYRHLDPDGYGNWEVAALTPMQGFAYATTARNTAARYAADRHRGADPGVVLVEADPALLLPDEDWIGCVAASLFDDCADCDMEIRQDADEAAYEDWAAVLPELVNAGTVDEIAAEIDFIRYEIDWDTFCALPMQAVLGRTIIRDVGRSSRGARWLREGLAFADRFAHRGPLPVVGQGGGLGQRATALLSGPKVRLGDLAEITTDTSEADFWLVRRGSENAVGQPTRVFNPEHFGVKVVRPDLVLPDYLYYLLMYVHGKGYWKPRARGTTRLVNIRAADVRALEMTFAR